MKKRKMRLSVRVHPAGYAMLAAALFFGPTDVTLAAVLALCWHEAAHLLAMLAAGVARCSVELTPFGGMADAAGYERLSMGKQTLIAIAGVAASAAAGFLCMRFAPREPFWYAFGNMHFSLALLNCLPVWPLDGARLVMAVGSRFGVETALRRGMLMLAYALAAALIALGLYGAWYGHINVSLFLLGPYLCYAAHESSVSQSVRNMQRARGAREKLSRQSVLPVRALACDKEPTTMALARLMARMSPQQFHFLYVVNSETGKIEKVLTEQELAGILFPKTSDQNKG